MFLINKPLFIKIAIFYRQITDLIFFGHSQPLIMPYHIPGNNGSIWHISQKKFMTKFLVSINCHILLKNHWSMKHFVGNFKLQIHPNICQETTVLSCMILGKNCLQKNYFTPKMIVWRKNIYALKSVHHYPWFDM